VPRVVVHTLLLLQSLFLYYAVIRLRENARTIQNCGVKKHLQIEDVAPISSGLKPLYIVTPTYTRATQLADLTRLANTLRLVPRVHWLVAEDSNTTSETVKELLVASKLTHTHLAARRPDELIGKIIGRGVFNRRAALDWIRANGESDGVIYFADDDNSYDVRIFEEIRHTKRVSVFPVGLILKYGVSSPIVRDGKVIGFYDAFQAGRKFAMDMAGFAVSVNWFKSKPKATFPAKVSYLEEGFMKSLEVSIGDLEPRAEECSRVWVWHTRTEKAATPKWEHISNGEWVGTNIDRLYTNLRALK